MQSSPGLGLRRIMRLRMPLPVLFCLLEIATGHPCRSHCPRINLHFPQTTIVRRDSTTTVPDTIPLPTKISEVVVFLGQEGQPIHTVTEVVIMVPSSTVTHVRPLSTQATTEGLTSSRMPAPPGPQSTHSGYLSPTHVLNASTVTDTHGLPAGPSSLGGSGSAAAVAILPGVTYSPYNSDGSCKSRSRVFSDLRKIASQYDLVRIYGVDCGQVATVVSAAKSTGLKLFLGIFNLDSLGKQIEELVNGVFAHGDWSVVESVGVRNELVNNGQATAEQVIDAVTATRQSLRSAGFHGPVVTVDTFVAVLRHPCLCDFSDFCAVNIHPFFDPSTPAEAAGTFVYNQVAAVRNVLKNTNQRIVVAETGWPWQGSANGEAVPGKDNQKAAIAAIKTVFGVGNPGNLILFSAFNDLWKKGEPSTFYTEQYWGINQF